MGFRCPCLTEVIGRARLQQLGRLYPRDASSRNQQIRMRFGRALVLENNEPAVHALGDVHFTAWRGIAALSLTWHAFAVNYLPQSVRTRLRCEWSRNQRRHHQNDYTNGPRTIPSFE